MNDRIQNQFTKIRLTSNGFSKRLRELDQTKYTWQNFSHQNFLQSPISYQSTLNLNSKFNEDNSGNVKERKNQAYGIQSQNFKRINNHLKTRSQTFRQQAQTNTQFPFLNLLKQKTNLNFEQKAQEIPLIKNKAKKITFNKYIKQIECPQSLRQKEKIYSFLFKNLTNQDQSQCTLNDILQQLIDKQERKFIYMN